MATISLWNYKLHNIWTPVLNTEKSHRKKYWKPNIIGTKNVEVEWKIMGKQCVARSLCWKGSSRVKNVTQVEVVQRGARL
jgi:hypothetical protein